MQLEELTVPLNLSKKAFDVGIAGAIAGIATLAGAVTGMVKLTFDWANELDSLGDVVGGTTDEVAALAFTARKSGVGVDAFTQANARMEAGLVNAVGGLDKVGKALLQYGINVRNSNGQVKTQAQLTDEIAKKFKSLGTQQEKVNFLTDIYGKEGAKLIDFFDTLNSDGGISAVEDKVKRLGLAIDPSRYEQFNRNLEELKLIGTGLAVSFTEKLMPSLEGVLNWVTTLATVPLDQKLKMLLDPLKLLFNFTDWFKQSVEETDWKGLSESLANKIKNIDWAKVGLYIQQGVKNVLSGIETVVSEIDWGALEDATGQALKGLVAGLYGYPDWESFASTVTLGFQYALTQAEAPFKEFKDNAVIGFKYIGYEWNIFVDGLKSKWTDGVDYVKQKAIDLVNFVITQINKIPVLGDIPLIPSMSTGSTSTGNGGVSNKRASGGAVIAGQSYNVAEFFQPEMFTPTQSGRVDPMTTAPQIDEDKIGRAVAKYLSKILPPIVQLARA